MRQECHALVAESVYIALLEEVFVTDTATKPTVIVVSSHVASGAVGNRAAVFALERLGFCVVAVPTVVLSWHPGEGPATRITPPDDAFADLIGDLTRADWLGSVGGILSGYLGRAGQAAPIATLVDAVKARNPKALYLCDPVTGDAAGAYVPPDVIEAVRTRLLPRADVATPNRHELSLMFGDAVAKDNQALVAMARRTGIAEVLITSAFAGPGQVANLLVTSGEVYSARHDAEVDAPHGTGDLMAALYLGRRLSGASASEALGSAVGSTRGLIERAAGATRLPLAEAQDVLVELAALCHVAQYFQHLAQCHSVAVRPILHQRLEDICDGENT